MIMPGDWAGASGRFSRKPHRRPGGPLLLPETRILC